MKHLILAKGLWGFVNGSVVLANETAASETTLFRSRLQKALTTIVLAIDESTLLDHFVRRTEAGMEHVEKSFRARNSCEQAVLEEAVFSF